MINAYLNKNKLPFFFKSHLINHEHQFVLIVAYKITNSYMEMANNLLNFMYLVSQLMLVNTKYIQNSTFHEIVKDQQ